MGGAGLMYPMLALLLLNIIVLSSWVIKGGGIKKTRVIISFSAFSLFCVFIYGVNTLETMPLARDISLIGALVTPIISLFLPAIYKRLRSDENT